MNASLPINIFRVVWESSAAQSWQCLMNRRAVFWECCTACLKQFWYRSETAIWRPRKRFFYPLHGMRTATVGLVKIQENCMMAPIGVSWLSRSMRLNWFRYGESQWTQPNRPAECWLKIFAIELSLAWNFYCYSKIVDTTPCAFFVLEDRRESHVHFDGENQEKKIFSVAQMLSSHSVRCFVAPHHTHLSSQKFFSLLAEKESLIISPRLKSLLCRRAIKKSCVVLRLCKKRVTHSLRIKVFSFYNF